MNDVFTVFLHSKYSFTFNDRINKIKKYTVVYIYKLKLGLKQESAVNEMCGEILYRYRIKNLV